jgi:serine/threonine protein kinase
MSVAATSRYDTILKLASGGMATVWVGTVRGALGFRQLVAIKKPHPHLLEDAGYRNELVAEARLASLIHHANVIDVRDVEVDGDSISLVMDYIEGASLGELIVAASKLGKRLPPRVAVRIALDALAGLQAAHDLVDERGRHVGLVHRDVSPQNIVIGVDGLARVADFGVAKFSRKDAESSEGSLKGKLAYMAPEYIRGEPIDRRFDVYALGIVLWEALAGKRLFRGATDPDTIRLLLEHQAEPLATAAPEVAALDGVLATALARPLEERFQNARAMAAALESTALAAGLCGGHTEVIATLKELVGASMDARRALIRAKLANEPSVASLMGVPPLVDLPHLPHLPQVAQVAQVAEPPPTVVQGRDARGAVEPAPRTMAPSTQPMTPRMEGAPRDPRDFRTLQSAGASQPPAAAPHIGNSTMPSATPMRQGSDPSVATPPADPSDPQLAFNDPSARTAHEVDPPPQVPKNKTLPVVAGVVVALAVSAAIALFATRSRSTHGAPDPARLVAAAAEGSSSGPAPAPPSPPTTILRAASASSPASPLPSLAAAPSVAAGGKPKPLASAARRGAQAGASPPALAPALPPGSPTPATDTGKKPPPPNPYANE